jgi:hypothetical protein
MMSRGTMNSLYFIFHRLKSMQTEIFDFAVRDDCVAVLSCRQ